MKDNWSIERCFSATYWCKWPKGTEIDAATCERARCACVEGLTASLFRAVSGQTNTAATRRATGGANVASEASYWCNRHETSEIQARAYARHSYAHAQHIHRVARSLALAVQCETMHGVMPAYEFRRGFCTLVLSLYTASLPSKKRLVIGTHLSCPVVCCSLLLKRPQTPS